MCDVGHAMQSLCKSSLLHDNFSESQCVLCRVWIDAKSVMGVSSMLQDMWISTEQQRARSI